MSTRRPSLTPSASSTPSTSSSSLLSPTPPLQTPYWQPQPSPAMPGLNSFTSTPEMMSPHLGHQSFPFLLNTQNPQAVSDMAQQFFPQGQVHSFTRRFKNKLGKTQAPGLKDLPHNIQSNFRNLFIRHIMKLVFSDTSPWNNPSLSVYQREFDTVYSPLQYCLHADDAVILPVSDFTYII